MPYQVARQNYDAEQPQPRHQQPDRVKRPKRCSDNTGIQQVNRQVDALMNEQPNLLRDHSGIEPGKIAACDICNVIVRHPQLSYIRVMLPPRCALRPAGEHGTDTRKPRPYRGYSPGTRDAPPAPTPDNSSNTM